MPRKASKKKETEQGKKNQRDKKYKNENEALFFFHKVVGYRYLFKFFCFFPSY